MLIKKFLYLVQLDQWVMHVQMILIMMVYQINMTAVQIRNRLLQYRLRSIYWLIYLVILQMSRCLGGMFQIR